MPYLILFVSLTVLSQSSIFVRIADASVYAIGFWRLLVACLVLGTYVGFKGKFKDLRHLKARTWGWLILCGVFLFSHWITWFISSKHTSSTNAVILFCSNPLYTAIGAWIFFGEKISWRLALSLTCCFGGIVLMVGENFHWHSENTYGDLVGFVSSILFSAYVLTSKRVRGDLSNLPFTFTIYSLALLGFSFLYFSQDTFTIAYSAKTWAAFLALAFGSTLLGHALFTYSMNFFSVNTLSVATLAEPILTAIVAYLFFGDPLTMGTVGGFVLVAVGVGVLFWGREKAKIGR